MKLLQRNRSSNAGQELLGREIGGRFLLIDRLGEGRSATVYTALDAMHGIVALKLGNPNPWDVNTFRYEAHALSRMAHKSIVGIQSYGSHDGAPFIAMEHLEGRTLRDALLRMRPGFALSLEIASELCEALSHAHSQDVVHRDVKPKNIIFCEDGKVKLIDFGYATVDGRGVVAGHRMGNPLFMAPEQARNNNACDHRADIYAAGAVLFNLLSRMRSISHCVDMLRLAAARVSPESVALGYSGHEREARRIVATAMAQDPAGRFQSAGAMRDALDGVLTTFREAN